MRGAHRGVWCSKSTPLIEAELFAVQYKRPAPDGRALSCAAPYARKIQGLTASQNLPDARNRAPVTPVSLHISDVSAQRKVRGVKRGQETIGVLSPFVSAARRRHPRPPKAANDHALRGRKVAFSGTPLYRRKILRLLTRKRKSTGESRCFAFRDEDQSKIHSSAFSSPQYFLRVSRIARGPRLSSLNMRTTVSPTPISNKLTPK